MDIVSEHRSIVAKFPIFKTHFAHLHIYEDSDRHQNLISSFLYHPRTVHKILL